ncbi:MvdC/MvdD family ATP grasp protein [Flagellimonas abyssi]|uniref:ATP-grasp domain-containing protein n=1 Tax=Flagellimonas abyssi TaxID=2864871 RepID=A0ABS7EXY5_9FLAO|nr:hypothetical protein [Allomuricauda abyssi]MBW8201844.1 hypothetical protein [Allomuricauda abyssi]
MTKVLVITNKSDITSDFIIRSLKKENIDFYRFNTEELTKSLELTIDLSSKKYSIFDSNQELNIDLTSFSSVYYRRPELPLISNEGLTNGELKFIQNEIIFSLEGVYKILKNAYWISPLYSIREAENKIYQLQLAESLGFKIPESIISNSAKNIRSFYSKNNEECIIKPVKSGLIDDEKESKVVFTNKLKILPTSDNKIKVSPNFLQTEIKKKGDIRVIVVGNKIFSTLIDSQSNDSTKTDWRKGEKPLNHQKINLPKQVENKCISLLRKLNLRYGAIDFILDKSGNYIFLEINPNGQWAWIENQTGYPISKEIVTLLKNENF